MNVDFIIDPGHGWLKVPLCVLDQWGLLPQITPYSYIRLGVRQSFAYLEEDCDASVFMDAAKQRGVSIKLRRRVAGQKESKVRRYEAFTCVRAHNYLALTRRA